MFMSDPVDDWLQYNPVASIIINRGYDDPISLSTAA